MIKFTGRNYGNAGILALATPTVYWAQKRADKDRALQYEAAIGSIEEQSRVQLQQDIAQQKQKYDQIRNLSLLAPDQNRINMVADELEKSIMDKVKNKYGGNLDRYLKEGADSDYEQYKNAIRQSDAYKDGNNNKVNMAQYIEDQKQGRIPMLVGGRNANDVLADFQTGKTRQFSYQGAYKPPTDFAKRIQDSYGNDRFTKQAADPARVILELQQDGLTLKQAMDYYQQAGLAVNPIYHKTDDAYEKRKLDEESALNQARINKLNQPPKDTTKQNRDVFSSVKNIATQDVNRPFMGKNERFSVSKPLSKIETDLAMNYANGTYDAKTGFYSMQKGRKYLSADGTTELSGISQVYNPRIVVRKDPKNPDLDQVFIQADGVMTEADAEKEGSRLTNGKSGSIESFFSNDEQIGGSALINKAPAWKLGFGTGPDGYKYEIKDILIPIGNNTEFMDDAINKKFGLNQPNYNPLTDESLNPAAALY